MYQQKGSLII